VTGVLVTALAVVIGRVTPSESTGAQLIEAPGHKPSRHEVVNETPGRTSLRILDIETGAVERVRFAGAGLLRFAACSPWRSASGHTEVIAQWNGRVASGGWGMGLTRFELPGGKLLNRVELDLVPRGSPCWFPDGSPRVLLPGGDGRLYYYCFEEG